MLSALMAEGLQARITRLGDPPHDRGHIQVEMPVKGRARFVLQGGRGEDGRMHWRSVWDGNESKAGRKRFFRAVATPAYAAMVRVLRDGRRTVQPDLFAIQPAQTSLTGETAEAEQPERRIRMREARSTVQEGGEGRN
ncbi:hypothetical protein ROTAS13_04554 [Roseomonas sp. TAS13]|uniref:hypothetical protein n=1 Tax=Roseomonas TaxID=125216 RepID=UPI00096067A8|nr:MULTISPECIES: hypothetical protein [Roseomonas]MCG7353742.1 hypothetical protein [Roseomonas mucosa]MCG7359124.1 hypothetical protein [Roseomonas mucosa]GAV36865.1 hypothetical protein ROTAS13_04554 [Roseomonas sp. TAS13]